jgi:TRAP-type uncharacterized transport system fused permease subunit
MIAYAGMMQGHWLRRASIVERVLLGFAALCLFTPNIFSDLIGIGLMILATFLNRSK